MNVYWGYCNSGKLHVELHAKYNSMTLLKVNWKNIFKTKNKVHNRGISRKGNYWIFRDLEKKLYGRDKDKFISSESIRTNEIKRFRFTPSDSYINPLSKAYRDFILSLKEIDTSTETKNEMKTFTDDDIKKFLEDEYKGSYLREHAMMEYIVNKELEDLGYEMLNNNADEIFDDVDLVMNLIIADFKNNSKNPYGYEDGRGFCQNHFFVQQIGKSKIYDIPENVLNKLRKANNVIPYKSDIFSWAVSSIDSFFHITEHKYDEKQQILEKYLYDKNIKLVFQYLDHQLYLPIKIAEFLTKRNIPYRYFDLDNDSYNEVFGGNFELDRNYTSHAPIYERYKDRYNHVADIAKKYISERNLPSYYTPNKL